MRKSICVFAALALAFGLSMLGRQSVAFAQDPQSDGLVALGKALFFDANLSVNGTQSCATCHAPETGFTGPDVSVNAGGTVYQGALPNHFGNRKPPTSAYAGESSSLLL